MTRLSSAVRKTRVLALSAAISLLSHGCRNEWATYSPAGSSFELQMPRPDAKGQSVVSEKFGGRVIQVAEVAQSARIINFLTAFLGNVIYSVEEFDSPKDLTAAELQEAMRDLVVSQAGRLATASALEEWPWTESCPAGRRFRIRNPDGAVHWFWECTFSGRVILLRAASLRHGPAVDPDRRFADSFRILAGTSDK